jgi:hypothetical protein
MAKTKVNTVAYDKNGTSLCVGNYFIWVLASNRPIYQVTQVTDFGVRAYQVHPKCSYEYDFSFPSRELEFVSDEDLFYRLLTKEGDV